MKIADRGVGFRARARVRLDRLEQVGRSPIMQKKHTLTDAPERRGAELVRAGISLRDAVREASTHVMQGQIGEKIGWHLRKGCWRVLG